MIQISKVEHNENTENLLKKRPPNVLLTPGQFGQQHCHRSYGCNMAIREKLRRSQTGELISGLRGNERRLDMGFCF